MARLQEDAIAVETTRRFLSTLGGLVAASILAICCPYTCLAAATECIGSAGICTTYTPTTCTVSNSVTVQPGAFIDCGSRDVTISGSGAQLKVSGGTFALHARNLIIEQGRQILVNDSMTSTVGVEIELEESLSLSGQIIARNAGQGSFVSVTAGGFVDLLDNTPAIDVSGSQESTDGGYVSLSGGTRVRVARRIDANGKDNGTENNINAGGVVFIDSSGDISIEDEIRAHGRWFGGGYVQIVSGHDVIVSYQAGAGLPKGSIQAEGKNLTGYGGNLDLAAAHAVSLAGPVMLGGGINNSGGEAGGGELYISAGCGGLIASSSVDLTGGAGGGGSLYAQTDGPITISGTIDANSRNLGGDGGLVTLASGGAVTVTVPGRVYANGHNTASSGIDGVGGIILFQGCAVEVADDSATGGQLTATGAAGGAMSLEGSRGVSESSPNSVRVGDKALVDVTGDSSEGELFLEVAEFRSHCSNNVNLLCHTNGDCPNGCPQGTCIFTNPNTDAALTQFKPKVVIEENADLDFCIACP